MNESLHPPAILPPREVRSAEEHKAVERYASSSHVDPCLELRRVGPLPHLSAGHWEAMGVPIIPRPATKPQFFSSEERPKDTLMNEKQRSKWRPIHGSNYYTRAQESQVCDRENGGTCRGLGGPILPHSKDPKSQKQLSPSTRSDMAFSSKRKDSVLHQQHDNFHFWIKKNEELWRHFQESNAQSAPVQDSTEKFSGHGISVCNDKVSMDPQTLQHWQEYWDEEVGASYYYNTMTGEASWVPPP